MTGILAGLGLAAAAGLNAWLILLLFNGLYLLLPLEFPGPAAPWLASHGVLTAALILFLMEFVADKIPIVDHLWNVAQTLLRPLVGALLVLSCVSESSDLGRAGFALAGASATLATHLAKSTTRLTSTAATRGFAQIVLSLAEDVVAVALAALMGTRQSGLPPLRVADPVRDLGQLAQARGGVLSMRAEGKKIESDLFGYP